MEEISYLTNISDELILKICSYLDTFDIIQLSKVLGIARFSADKILVRKVSFYRDYRFRIRHWKEFVLNRLRSEVITSLNLNCVYWIPACELRSGVDKLTNLEHLYVVDTQLSLRTEDVGFYNSFEHLKTIAVTLVKQELGYDGHFPLRIINLYLHIEYCTPSLLDLISGLKYLEELWVIHLKACNDTYLCTKLLPDRVGEVAELNSSSTSLFFLNIFNFYNVLYFHSFKCKRGTQMCSRYDHFTYRWRDKYPLWDVLLDPDRFCYPFNMETSEVSKKLMFEQSSPDQVQFEELNMRHYYANCSEHVKSALRTLLVGANMKSLKKLAINTCLCEQGSNATDGASSSLPTKSTLEQIVQNCPLIEELELWMCCPNMEQKEEINTSLGSIQFLVNLKKLTLDGIPEELTGQFLVDICKECRYLESLRIQSYKSNSDLNHYLSIALGYASALKDLRYQQPDIAIGKIIESFNKGKNLNLERIVLRGGNTDMFSVVDFETFLSNHHQLKFLYIIIRNSSICGIQELSRITRRYKFCPQKVFTVTRDELQFCDPLPTPHIHRCEMLECNTNVSVLDIFNGFVKQ